MDGHEEPGLHLLVWDAPNMDMTLSTAIGGRPTPDTRPSFTAVGRWLSGRATEGRAEACVFTNIVPGSEARVVPWITAVRTAGFAVFAKPKVEAEDDIDDHLAAHIRLRAGEGAVAEVVVASHDAAAFGELLEEMAAAGTRATVLGFEEFASFANRSPVIEFIDLESIAGVFPKPLPRTNLAALPPEGAWLAPLSPLPAAGAEVADVRAAIIAALIDAAQGDGTLLATFGGALNRAVPGIDLKSLGYSKLRDAVLDLADEAGVEMVENDAGHPMVRLRERMVDEV